MDMHSKWNKCVMLTQ